jgi:hypothetical protein
MAGKKWTAEQEAQLKALVDAGASVDEVAAKLQKTPRRHNREMPTPEVTTPR